MSENADRIPIGIFDSGLGGLSVAHHCQRLLPSRDFYYYGDTARAPYGNKSPHAITSWTEQALRQLENRGVCAVLIACSTACAVALPHLQDAFPFPLIDVIEPGARLALSHTQGRGIAVLATRATVDSGAYTRAFAQLQAKAFVGEIACPQLAATIDAGLIDHPKTLDLLNEYLSDPILQEVDTVLLGCTHYAFVRQALERLRPDLRIIDPAGACAHRLAQQLHLSAPPSRSAGKWSFEFSESSQTWIERSHDFLGRLQELAMN